MSRKLVIEYARRALADDNARPFDGDPNYRYRIEISVGVVGPYSPRGGVPSQWDGGAEGGFAFSARVPCTVTNSLGSTIRWGNDGTVTRAEAAAFFRELANMISNEGA